MRDDCEAFCEFSVAAARRLTGVPAEHPCARLHGHTFLVRVTVRGPIDQRTGFVADFADIQRAWVPVGAALDHRNLNQVDGLENPTSENIARWIWRALAGNLSALASVEVRETGNSGVVYRG